MNLSLRKLRALVLTALTLTAMTASAATYRPLPEELDGTMMPYRMPPEKEWLQAPDTLTPFHIEYVGRHGARYLSSEKKLFPLLTILQEQKKAKNLSSTGEAMLTLLEKIRKDSEGKWGALSEVGVREQTDLGNQMSTQWKGLFTQPDIEVNAISSDVPRVVNSMYNFLHALGARHVNATVNASSGEVYSPLMRFFETNPDYRDWLAGKLKGVDSWEGPELEVQKKYVAEGPARRLFKKVPVINEIEYTLNGQTKHRRFDSDGMTAMQALSMEMYGVLQSLRASGMGEPTTRWMSEDEYRGCWTAANADQWLKRSLNPFSTLPERAAVPLLMDIVGKADAAVGSLQLSQLKEKKEKTVEIPSPAANLRFGHAETIMPLAALMNLPECAELPLDLDLIAKEWHNYYVSPLAANIEIVLAQGPSGRIYAAVALNGQPVVMKGQENIWLPWAKLRDCWLHLAASY